MKHVIFWAALATCATNAVSANAASRFVSDDTPVFREKLMIVDRNAGRVIYDDGNDDLFCSVRRKFAGYRHDGRPRYRRIVTCR
jgi:hypothetical protein